MEGTWYKYRWRNPKKEDAKPSRVPTQDLEEIRYTTGHFRSFHVFILVF